MATLYKRANPLQKKLLKMVEGAVKNTYHAHPTGVLDIIDMDKFARSVAKRAVGTISSQMRILPLEEISGGELLASGNAEVSKGGGDRHDLPS